MKFNQLAAIILILLAPITILAQDNLPIPENTNLVILARPQLLSADAAILNLYPGIADISNLSKNFGIEKNKISHIACFFAIDTEGIRKFKAFGFGAINVNDAFIISGDFKAKTVLKKLKSEGWIEKDFPGKKFLWWSTGTYLENDITGLCITEVIGAGLLAGGSERILTKIMEIKIGKQNGKIKSQLLEKSISGFENASLQEAAIYLEMTPEIAKAIQDEIRDNIKSQKWLGNITQYIN